MSGKKTKLQLSELVFTICHTTRNLSAAFLVLSVLALLFLAPGEVERGLYAFIIVMNAVVFVGSILLDRFMRRSDRTYMEKTGARRADADADKGISGWLARKDREKAAGKDD